MSILGREGVKPGFLEADPVVSTSYANVLGAVSANFVQLEDVKSTDWAAQIRLKAGIHAYLKDKATKVALLNMAYHAAYLIATSNDRFKYESFQANDEIFYAGYSKAYNVLTGTKEDDNAKPTSAAQGMIDLYNYLFK
jgi:hypothetical protein